MPTYDYRCTATGECYEVHHSIKEKLSTWGELCQITGRDAGDIALDSPVERLATGGQVVSRSALNNPDLPPCTSGNGCPRGGCGV
ncbi:zinc ribbon domain-containing protein [Motiliproteus sp. MSK22-1]|uniref:zinc ribbon domain-containing protein n=1 Tax=Motiliproteus sp. MSK22-1 TaxID=1897630 RepID=UPI00097758FA|nr:zinc ribbon domain-containing protein [Motiliproteus sp. MSK22-1]OMH38134.1 regulator [Motiliproteus sp. MSK22-1]